MSSKHLILVRHAAAGWETGQPDFARTLTTDGERCAAAMGRFLHEREVTADAVVTSPAPRAAATAEALRQALALPTEALSADGRIYEAPCGRLVEVVHGFPVQAGTVILVGHNPGLSHLADFLLGEPRVMDMPTGAVVWLALHPGRDWASVKPGSAALRHFWRPSDLGLR